MIDKTLCEKLCLKNILMSFYFINFFNKKSNQLDRMII